jgi:quinolinate synthase
VNGEGPHPHATALSSSSSPSPLATTAAQAAVAPHAQSIEAFPSLIIGRRERRGGREGGSGEGTFIVEPIGPFAEAQAAFLDPDPSSVSRLVELMVETNTGIVAHYYMDVELQGVLTAAQKQLHQVQEEDERGGNRRRSFKNIGIADSLKMGDMAVEMARGGGSSDTGVRQVICLGVDFMAESVQAILQQNQFSNVPVYRADSRRIGCSLAEAAERQAYRAWLHRESSSSSSCDGQKNALHVVYINTSLETKAVSSSIVPTITCTSSNVLATILQASVQIPHLKLLYGPDTYMGENLVALLNVLIDSWDDAKVASSLHPLHTVDSLRKLRDSISVFPSGNCVVHHMFGQAVVDTVKGRYQDAYVTAHLEVPGEMFEIAMAKSLTDDGVVGSTSDILNFIVRKVRQAAKEEQETPSSSSAAGEHPIRRLRFILGTEAGMVTSIVQNVQQILEEAGNSSVQAEIIFPVSSEAVMSTEGQDVVDGAVPSSSLPLVPGVGGGEGCSTAGGCATCPFMKMNHLDALIEVLERIRDGKYEHLQGHLPPDRLSGKSLNGVPAVELGTQSIQYMRYFMQHQTLPDELVQKVQRQQIAAPSLSSQPSQRLQQQQSQHQDR